MNVTARLSQQQRQSPATRPAPPARRQTTPVIGNQARLRLQTKLEIAAVNDPLEHEADAAADRVMRQATATLQRKCAACDEEYKGALQRSAEPADPLAGVPVPDSVPRAISGPGQKLDGPTRNFMESGFGHDFSSVRIHTDSAAAASARDVSARAYTVGEHIAFNQGAYQPGSAQGKRLLAHELAHVVQQGGGARRKTEPRLQRDFDSTLSICARLLNSRSFDVANGNVAVTLNATLGRPPDYQLGGEAVEQPASPCSGKYFYVSLEKEGTISDSEIGTHPVPYGGARTRSWSNLAAGKYHLIFWTNDTNPTCCLDGTVSVTTPDAAPQVQAPAMSTGACFDGDQLYVNNGGQTINCPALSGTKGDPTPPGTYCIRHQGEAQTRGGLKGMLLQDRPHWFLLEPQFATSRSRMMLHPGVMSSGCITVMDHGCFNQAAAALESGGGATATGYDGYPPGNAEGVQNQKHDVTCAAMLTVSDKIGSCGGGAASVRPTAEPAKQAPELQRSPLSDAPALLQREPQPPAPAPAPAMSPPPTAPPTAAPTPVNAPPTTATAAAPPANATPAAPNFSDWLTLFPAANRDGSRAAPNLTVELQKTQKDPILHDADQGGLVGPLKPEQTAARDRIVAARAALPPVKFTFGAFNGGFGYQYGGKTPEKPTQLKADDKATADAKAAASAPTTPDAGAPASPPDATSQRERDVRAAIFEELSQNEGKASGINAYDGAKLTLGPGIAMTGPLPDVLNKIFADPKTHEFFLKSGIEWSGGAFKIFNEANNAVEQGASAMAMIQGRKDLLAAFVTAAESPETASTVVDAELPVIVQRINKLPAKIRSDWNLDALRITFHLDYMASAWGVSKYPKEYLATAGDIMKIVVTWGTLAAGKPEPSGACMISSDGFKLAIPQFQKWGHGAAWKAITAVCPVPIAITRAEVRDPGRTELKDLVLIRTLEATKDEPDGFYTLPKQPIAAAAGATADKDYYALYELNGVPPPEQIPRIKHYATADLTQLIDAWDNRGQAAAFGAGALGYMLKAVKLIKTSKKPAKGPDTAIDSFLADPGFTAMEAKDPARAKLIRDYVAR
jgi:hypothetical protein